MSKEKDDEEVDFQDVDPKKNPLEYSPYGEEVESEDEEGEEESEDEGGKTLEDVGLIEGLTVGIKWKLGMEIDDEYEKFLVGGEEESMSEQHKDLISPSGADFGQPTKAMVDGEWTVSGFTSNFPTDPDPLFLRGAFEVPRTMADYTIHVDPYTNTDGIRFLRNQVDNLRNQIREGQEGGEVDQSDTQQDYQVATQMLESIQNRSTELFDVSMYTTVRSLDDETVEREWDKTKNTLEQAPAQTNQVRATYVQDKARKTTSPIGKDLLGYDRQMLGGAVGSMLPMTTKSMVEESGVYLGIHNGNGSPVFVDRFDREGGYNQLTIGSIGSGKSFSAKMSILREYAQRDDLTVIILDPLEGFVDFVDGLGGERIRVGGNQAVNPMEIRQIDNEDFEKMEAEEDNMSKNEEDPFNQKLQQVEVFFRSFFRQQGAGLGDRLSTLKKAIRRTYFAKGIDQRISTHGKESPTIDDLRKQLYRMQKDPERYAYTVETSEEEESFSANSLDEMSEEDFDNIDDGDLSPNAEKIREDAVWLNNQLSPFGEEGSQYRMLARQTEVDLMSSDVVYLDIGQNEMNLDNQGLMMQLLFDAVYQRSKETDNKVLFAIDEAHVMMQDEESLDMLETAVRHSRHYDMSINFITQEANDFFQSEQAKAISNNCTIKQIQRVTSMSEEARKGIGLTEGQAEKVRNLKSGKQNKQTIFGNTYSTALVYVEPEGWFPVAVVASSVEAEIEKHGLKEVMRRINEQKEQQ